MKTLFKVVLSLLSTVSVADSLTLDTVGITEHGAGTYGQGQYALMKNRVSSVGDAVVNPELNVAYERANWLLNGAYLKDCYGNASYLFAVGRQWTISADKTWHIGALAALFVHTEPTLVTNTVKRSFGLSTPHPTYVRFNTYRTLMPLFFVDKDLNITHTVAFNAKLATNYWLTHLLFGVKLKLL